MRIPENSFLRTTPIAHRGLHDIKKGIPENSYAAYQAAIDKNYAIEMDVRFSKDGKLVVFHDDTLDRTTEAKGPAISKTRNELLELHLQGTQQKIPVFEEFLEFVGGKAPLLIELKNVPERKDLVRAKLAALKNYKGEFALQSFQPKYVYQMKKQAPQILRGQLATIPLKEEIMPAVQKWALKNMPFHFLTKPDFISFNIANLPFSKARRKNALLLGWTARTEEEYLRVKPMIDNVIFEYITPEKL